MYPASPVSPIMPDAKPKRNDPLCSTAGDLESKYQDINCNRSLSQEDRRSPASTTASAKSEHKSPSSTSGSPRSRKRKQSPECPAEFGLGKRPKLAQTATPPMSLDINDIGMPGRSGSTRSRTKVPITERRRVPVACDSCRHRKIKCNGESPCQNCSKSSYECHFPPVSAKIVVEENWVERLQGRCSALERALVEAIPDPEKREELAAHYGLRLMIRSSSPSDQSDSELGPANNNAISYNPEGKAGGIDTDAYSFIGDSASLTFMNKIKEFVRETLPLQTQMNTFSDPVSTFTAAALEPSRYYSAPAPLPLPATDPYVLPQKPTVISLVQKFVGFIGCGTTTATMTASGGVYYWFDAERLIRDLESLYTSVNMGMLGLTEQSRPVDYTILCMVNAVLALSCQSTASSGIGPLDVEEEAIAGDADFWRSLVSRKASHENRPITPEQAFTPTSPHSALSEYGEPQPAYFNTSSDYSSASSVGNTHHFQPGMTFFARAKTLMVNPSDAPSISTLRTLSMLSYFLLSANRWEAAYLHIGLAVRLAVANGLHRRRNSNDIAGLTDLEIQMKRREEEDRKRTFWTIYILDRLVSCMTGRPVMLSDDALDTELPVNIEGLPPASGLRAHAELAKIMGDIIMNVYPIRRPEENAQTKHQLILQTIQQAHSDLTSWHDNLPEELRLVNGVARERGVLWLHSLYNELLMLTCRPSLLLAMKRTSASILSTSQNPSAIPGSVYDHAIMCITAAGSNLLLARQIQASGWVNASYTECSYVFNAGMTLSLARLIAPPGPEWSGGQSEEDVQYAIAFLQTLGKESNYPAQRYAKDLIELNSAVSSLIEVRNLNVSLQALGGPPTCGISLAPRAAPTLVPSLAYQPVSQVQDFSLFDHETAGFLSHGWINL